MSLRVINPDLTDAYHMYQFYSCLDCLRSPKRFESLHGSTPAFDILVILLNQIIQILTLPDSNTFMFAYLH